VPTPIHISFGNHVVEAELNDGPTAQRVIASLPIEASASRWGEEAFVLTNVDPVPDEPTKTILEVGEIAFWPPGRAFCVFWGPTPASQGDEPAAGGPVVSLGKVTGDAMLLNKVCDCEFMLVQVAP
jgi:hypothetical protein